MIQYQYAVIRFLPNPVVGEFVNVGVVYLWHKVSDTIPALKEDLSSFPSEGFGFRFTPNTQRVSLAFSEFDGAWCGQLIKMAKNRAESVSHRYHPQVKRPTFEELLLEIVSPNSLGGLTHSEVRGGISRNPDKMSDNIYQENVGFRDHEHL